MQALCAVGPPLLPSDDRGWMFANVALLGQSIHEHLQLFFADPPFGPFEPRGANPVKSAFRGTRPSGKAFGAEGTLRWPGQNCACVYGEDIVLHRVTRLNAGEFAKEEVGVIGRGW